MPHSQDLETIVTCFEAAAVCMTDVEGRTFTKAEIFDYAHKLEPAMQRRDMETVFAGMTKTFARVGREYTLR